jgi:hypothetical protein
VGIGRDGLLEQAVEERSSGPRCRARRRLKRKVNSSIVHARLRVLGHRPRTLRREGDGSRYPTAGDGCDPTDAAPGVDGPARPRRAHASIADSADSAWRMPSPRIPGSPDAHAAVRGHGTVAHSVCRMPLRNASIPRSIALGRSVAPMLRPPPEHRNIHSAERRSTASCWRASTPLHVMREPCSSPSAPLCYFNGRQYSLPTPTMTGRRRITGRTMTAHAPGLVSARIRRPSSCSATGLVLAPRDVQQMVDYHTG